MLQLELTPTPRRGARVHGAHAISFQEMLRRNNIYANSFAPTSTAEEREPLRRQQTEPTRAAWCLQTSVTVAVALITLASLLSVISMAVFAFEVRAALHSTTAEVLPVGKQLLGAASSIVNDTTAALRHVHHVAEAGEEVAVAGSPKMLGLLENAESLTSLAAGVARHPSIKISLSGEDT